MRLYLAFINNSNHVDRLCQNSTLYHRIDDNLVGVLDDIDSFDRVVEIRDALMRDLGDDSHVFVIRCVDDFSAAWYLSEEGSRWVKSNL